MDYNDIIVIMLLIIIIMGLGLILFKKEYSHFTQTEHLDSYLQNHLPANSYSAMNNYHSPIKSEYLKCDNNMSSSTNNVNNNNGYDNIFYDTNNNKKTKKNIIDVPYKNIVNIDSLNTKNISKREVGINDKLANIKNNKNKNSFILKNKNNICMDENKINYNLLKNDKDLQSLDNNSLLSLNNLDYYMKINDIDKKKT